MQTCNQHHHALGESKRSAEIRILYNPEIEWHESFVAVLEDFHGASAGENNSATINILDTDSAGGLVLPSVPIVSYQILLGKKLQQKSISIF